MRRLFSNGSVLLPLSLFLWVGCVTESYCEFTECQISSFSEDRAQWHFEFANPAFHNIRSLTFVPIPNAYELIGVGNHSRIMENKGGVWQEPAIPENFHFYSLHAITTNSVGVVLAVGDPEAGFFLKVGNEWSYHASFSFSSLNGIWADPDPLSDTFFVVGNRGSFYQITNQGQTWYRETTPQFTMKMNGVYGVGYEQDLQLYVVGEKGTIILRTNGEYTKIDPYLIPQLQHQDLYAVWIGPGPNYPLYIAGEEGFLVRFENNQWFEEKLPPFYHQIPTHTITLRAITGIQDEVVVVGENGAIFHKKKGVWKAEAEGFTQETLTTVVSIPNGNYQFSFYAAGNEGGIFRYY